MVEVKIYSTPTCPWCKKAKEFFKEHKIKYVDYNVAEDEKSQKEMIKKQKINRKEYYQCEICKFYYAKKKWAEKFQAWCKIHKSCNIEITKYAVNLKEKTGGVVRWTYQL